MSEIERRSFLSGLVALPFIHGLGPPFPLNDRARSAEQALSMTRSSGRFGVVIRVPQDPEARLLLGRRLFALTELDDEDHEAHDLFCEAVFLALPEEPWQRRFPEQGGGDRALLSPTGEFLAGDRSGPDVYADAAKFAASFRPFIRGVDGARLEERGRAVEAAMPEELREAAHAIAAEDGAVRMRALLALRSAQDSILPWLAWRAERAPDEPERREARGILREQFRTLSRHQAGGRLPYGTAVPELQVRVQPPIDPGAEPGVFGCTIGRRSKRSGLAVTFLPG
jgi:hypothetical protein